jgi:signal transduction histidine kinase
MKFLETRWSRSASYAVALIAVISALTARQILGLTLVRNDFLWVLPLAGVYAASIFGGKGPGLLSIGLMLVGVELMHWLSHSFPQIGYEENLTLQGLFLVLALGIWYLASTRRTAVENASREVAERKRTISQLEELLSMVSHDMRSPLNSIKLSLYIIKSLADEGQPRVQRALTVTDQQIERILNLVDRLLEPIKMGSSSQDLRLADFDLATLVKTTTEAMAPETEGAGCPVELELESVWGRWDSFRLERVLVNLLSNALKYAAGTTIRIRLEGQPGIARLTIQDNGPGIAPEDREAIFRRFETANSDKGKRETLGLGLYIARRIVQAHGGELTVESELGKGATFIVILPIVTESPGVSTLVRTQHLPKIESQALAAQR